MKNIQSKLWIFGDSFSKGLGLIDDGHQFDLYKGKEKFSNTLYIMSEIF